MPAHAPFARRRRIALKYAEMETVLSYTAAAAHSGFVYNVNSLYDPYSGIGGHQPYGFDALASIYKKYVVTGCRVTVTFVNPAANGLGTVGLYYYDAQAETAPGAGVSVSDLAERPRSIVAELGTSGNDKANRTLSVYLSTHKILDTTYNDVLTDDDYQAAVTADPAKLARFYIWYKNASGDTASITYNLRITYYGYVFEPISTLES